MTMARGGGVSVTDHREVMLLGECQPPNLLHEPRAGRKPDVSVHSGIRWICFIEKARRLVTALRDRIVTLQKLRRRAVPHSWPGALVTHPRADYWARGRKSRQRSGDQMS
jgi:hypothetical protein